MEEDMHKKYKADLLTIAEEINKYYDDVIYYDI